MLINLLARVLIVSASPPSPLSHLASQQHVPFQAHVDLFVGEDVSPQFISLASYHYGFTKSNMV
jgi:hypothetical protein